MGECQSLCLPSGLLCAHHFLGSGAPGLGLSPHALTSPRTPTWCFGTACGLVCVCQPPDSTSVIRTHLWAPLDTRLPQGPHAERAGPRRNPAGGQVMTCAAEALGAPKTEQRPPGRGHGTRRPRLAGKSDLVPRCWAGDTAHSPLLGQGEVSPRTVCRGSA